VWTSTKQRPYYLLNVALLPRSPSSFNALPSLGVHISDTSASCSTPNPFSQNTYTPLYTRPPVLFLNFSSSSPVTQHYPYPTNSLYINYWSVLYSPTLPPFGAIHRLPTNVNFKFFNPNVFESLVIIPEAPLSHTYTLPLTLNPFTRLFTVWLINSSTAVQHTPTLFSVKDGTTHYLTSTGNIENI